MHSCFPILEVFSFQFVLRVILERACFPKFSLREKIEIIKLYFNTVNNQ